jgi:hypothetical protein
MKYFILSLLFSLNVLAQETGPANSVMRVPSGGGKARMGSVNLAASAAVGSSVLAVPNGGTGIASGTSGGVPYFSAGTTIASSGALTVDQLIIGGGAGAAPSTLAAGSQYEVLRMGATTPGYGSIDLSQSALVGSSILPTANGGSNKPTWSANSVVFAASTSAFGEDNTNFAFDDTANQLTIANVSLTGALHGDIVADVTAGANQTIATPTKSVVRSTGAVTSIAGFTAPSNEQFFVWVNATGSAVTIINDATATAADRIITGSGSDISVANTASIWLLYDSTSSRWRIIGGSGGGGSITVGSDLTMTASDTLAISLISLNQSYRVQGNSGAITMSTTPFGSSAPLDGTLIELIGNSDTDPVSITWTDSAKGCVGNFGTLTLYKYEVAQFRYNSTIDRYIYVK